MMHCQIHWKQEKSIHLKTDSIFHCLSSFVLVDHQCILHKYTCV